MSPVVDVRTVSAQQASALLVGLAAAAGKVYANSKRLYAGKQTAGLAEWLGWLAR